MPFVLVVAITQNSNFKAPVSMATSNVFDTICREALQAPEPRAYMDKNVVALSSAAIGDTGGSSLYARSVSIKSVFQ